VLTDGDAVGIGAEANQGEEDALFEVTEDVRH
jgi:hypothetical protein